MMTSLYLYPAWLRLWHWINALLFLTLVASGVSMHYAGADWLMPFAAARVVHNTAGILLTVAWIGFVVANARSANARHYRVRFRTLIGDLIAQTRYYMIGIFRLEPHPFHVTEAMKFNTLQQLSYLGVMYGLMPILIISGWAFLYSVYLPETLFGLGSVWVVAMTHVVVSYLLALFLLVHMYIITTGETVFSNLRAMITGWHRENDPPRPETPASAPRETP
nr:cytochrome b/b6 domain-containing protein [Thiocapsa marina]